MSAFLVPMTVFLSAVFATSAIGKALSPDRGRAAFGALQLPVRYPNAAALTLVVVEALVALGLIVTTGWYFVVSSATASVLTAGLLVVVVRAHRLGVTDDCGCFGEWLPAAIGPQLITRNVILAVSALTVLIVAFVIQALGSVSAGLIGAFSSGSSAMTGLGSLAAGILIATGIWSIVQASRSSSSLASRVARGTGAVVLPDSAEVADLFAPGARARLLLFVSPGCHACETAMSALNDAYEPLSALVDIYVVQRAVSGSLQAPPRHPLPGSARHALDIGGTLGATLNIGPAAPVAALIGSDGSQAGPLALGSEETALLIESIRSLSDASSM